LRAFGDTSFIGSLYLHDANSDVAAARMAAIPMPLLLSSLGELELINALQLHVCRKEIHELDSRSSLSAFEADISSGVLAVRPISEAMFIEARRLSAKWSARLGTCSLDILQVAAAIVLEADSFHTFDDRQKKLAKAAGLVCR
jgi:predicted nucleic acid-binding protein